MKKLLPVLVLGFLIFQSCKKIPVGFLMTEYASYNPDSLVLKSVLDTTMTDILNPDYQMMLDFGFTHDQIVSGALGFAIPQYKKDYSNKEDYLRFKNNIPWATTPIQGLKGTAPIRIGVSEISPATPASEKMKKMITIRGSSGVIQIPLAHGLPAGRYTLSLAFSNEGWSKEIKNAFTIIIK